MVFHYSKLSHLASSLRPSAGQPFTFTRNAFPSTTGPAFQATNSSSPNNTNGKNGAGTGGGAKWSAGSRVPYWGFQQARLVSQTPAVDAGSIRLHDDENNDDHSVLTRGRAQFLRLQREREAADSQRRASLLSARPRRNSTSLSVEEDRVSKIEMHRRYWTAYEADSKANVKAQEVVKVEREADEQDLAPTTFVSSIGLQSQAINPPRLRAPVPSGLAPRSISFLGSSPASSTQPIQARAIHTITSTTPPLAHIPRVRRNSTSAVPSSSKPFSPDSDFLTAALQTPRPQRSVPRPRASNPEDAPPRRIQVSRRTPPPEFAADAENGELSSFKSILTGHRYAPAEQAVVEYLARDPASHTQASHVLAIRHLTRLRPAGHPIAVLQDLYASFWESPEVRPCDDAYRCAIRFLTDRDRELVARGPESAAQYDYFTPALKIFKSLGERAHTSHPVSVVDDVLAAAAARGRVDVAIALFAKLETTKSQRPTARSYESLIKLFTVTKDVDAVNEVFDDFLASPIFRVAPSTWAAMVESLFELGDDAAAVGVVEKMVKRNLDVPESIMAVVVKGFVKAGDAEAAKAWFERSNAVKPPFFEMTISAAIASGNVDLAHEFWLAMTAKDISQPVGLYMELVNAALAAEKPAVAAQLVEAFHSGNKRAIADEDKMALFTTFYPNTIRSLLAAGYVDAAAAASAAVPSMLGAIIARGAVWGGHTPKQLALQLAESTAAALGLPAGSPVDGSRPTWSFAPAPEEVDPSAFASMVAGALASLNPILDSFGLAREPAFEFAVVNAFLRHPAIASNTGAPVDLSPNRWFTVIESFALVASREAKGTPIPFAFPGFEPVIDHFFASTRETEKTLKKHKRAYGAMINALRESGMSEFRLLAIFSVLDPVVEDAIKSGEFAASAPLTPPASDAGAKSAFEPASSRNFDSVERVSPDAALAEVLGESGLPSPLATPPEYFDQLPVTPPATPPRQGLPEINLRTSKLIHDQIRLARSQDAYRLVKEAVSQGRWPHPDNFGRLIELLGREGRIDQVREMYLMAYSALPALDGQPEAQSIAWVQLEDHMIIALAHAGAMQEVAVHRLRLLQQGSAPSADGYAAMIINMNETTNDAAVAVELFEESQRQNVTPNVYLFNTLISKLSRARRAREVLQYFELMKVAGIQPTAITYGAVINACCKTGDAASAEYLFTEMTASPGFKPRVPPYNTLIQFFTSTKPDRDRALHYYDQMLSAGVKPTGHTYKLLLDAYGAIGEPDVSSMKDVFDVLVSDESVTVTGSHWASLINTYGCILKDFDRATGIFESIASHPSNKPVRGSKLPDAIVYESIFNTCIANNRPDLVEGYRVRMQQAGVPMTAYASNSIIKAHALQGDLDGARAVFESMSDPGAGVAAAGNHSVSRAPKHHHASSPVIPAGVVYREPSSWDTMIRVELGAGELERAEALLQRLEQRAFPDAIVERIRKLVSEARAPPVA